MPGEEAEKLRYHLWMMLIFHGFNFVLLEIIIYEWTTYLLIMELLYAYLAYQAIMSLELKWCYGYITFMGLSVFGIGYIGAVGNFICSIIFLLQIAIYVFVGGFLTCRRVGEYKDAMNRLPTDIEKN